MSTTEPDRRQTAAVCLLLLVATLMAYSSVRTFEFNNYDDRLYVTGNELVKDGLTWDGIVTVFTQPVAANWHPVTMISHMLDVQFFGLNSGAHHLVNLAFHLANSLLLLWVLLRITHDLWPSAAVAAIFALHPLHVEPVAWVASRKDVLSGFFALLSIWAYVRYAARPNGLRYLLICCFAALGLMAKPILIVLPILMLVFDYWPLSRFRFSPQINPCFAKGATRALVLEKVPLLLLAAASAVLTLWAQHSFGAVASMDRVPLIVRLANAVVALARYLGKTLWPFDLSFLYPHPGMWPLPVVLTAAIVLLLISGAAIINARRHPYFLSGWLWFGIALLPVLGLVQAGEQSMADRYMYLPLIGLALMAVWGIKALVQRHSGLAKTLPFAGAALAIVAALVTNIQANRWRTSETLYSHALTIHSNNATAHHLLADALRERGDNAGSLRHYYEALRIRPGDPATHHNLGVAFLNLGAFRDATRHLSQAVRSNPTNTAARFQLATALAASGDVPDAILHYQQGLEHDPTNIMALAYLGQLYASQTNFAAAATYFDRALAIAPQSLDAHYGYGLAHLRKGNPAEASKYFHQAIELNPSHVLSHRQLAIATAAQGKAAEAASHFREAIRLNPSFAEALNDLALLCATNVDPRVRNPHEALELAARACELTKHQQPIPLMTLAVAYSEAGKFEEALQIAASAEEIARTGPPELATKAEELLNRLRNRRRSAD